MNFIQATLADGHAKTGTQLMELFTEHAGLQEYNRKNLKQVFHRVSLSLADEGKIVVTRQLGTAPLLFSIPTENSQQEQHQQSAAENSPLAPEPNAIITQKLEQLIDQEAMLAGAPKRKIQAAILPVYSTWHSKIEKLWLALHEKAPLIISAKTWTN